MAVDAEAATVQCGEQKAVKCTVVYTVCPTLWWSSSSSRPCLVPTAPCLHALRGQACSTHRHQVPQQVLVAGGPCHTTPRWPKAQQAVHTSAHGRRAKRPNTHGASGRCRGGRGSRKGERGREGREGPFCIFYQRQHGHVGI